MKKTLLALLMTATAVLTGCGGGGDEGGGGESGGNVKLKIRFHVDSRDKEGIAYKTLVDNFNRDYASEGIKVTAQFVARTPGDSAYERELANEYEAGTLPDIITFDAPNCATYAYTGFLYDLTNLLSTDDKAQYITLNTYKGHVYGIPIQESSAGFYYNKKLFAQAGIDVSGYTVDNPWTFEQFKSVCAKLKTIGTIPVDMRFDATKDETAMYLLYPFVYAAGGSFVDSTGLTATGYFNSAKSKNAYKFFKSLISEGYTSNGI